MFGVNFEKIGKELSNARETETKYWRENDAKFRAIDQKVATYDQFRDIVMASHLQPIKRDRNNDWKPRNTWNHHASDKIHEPSFNSFLPKKIQFQDPMKQPQNLKEFLSTWHQLKDDTSARYDFLIRNELSFFTEMAPDLLGDILILLENNFRSEDWHKIYSLLSAMSSMNRFKLSKGMLTNCEKLAVDSLFKKLESEVVQEDLVILRGMYH